MLQLNLSGSHAQDNSKHLYPVFPNERKKQLEVMVMSVYFRSLHSLRDQGKEKGNLFLSFSCLAIIVITGTILFVYY
jgi:hypothetical protein